MESVDRQVDYMADATPTNSTFDNWDHVLNQARVSVHLRIFLYHTILNLDTLVWVVLADMSAKELFLLCIGESISRLPPGNCSWTISNDLTQSFRCKSRIFLSSANWQSLSSIHIYVISWSLIIMSVDKLSNPTTWLMPGWIILLYPVVQHSKMESVLHQPRVPLKYFRIFVYHTILKIWTIWRSATVLRLCLTRVLSESNLETTSEGPNRKLRKCPTRRTDDRLMLL